MGRIVDPNSLHKYLYVHNNPVSFLDPSGNITLQELSTSASSFTQLALRTSGNHLKKYIGKNKGSEVFFGNPPDSFGLVGEFVLNEVQSIIFPYIGVDLDILIDSFSNSGGFGTAVHKQLENSLNNISPFESVTIEAEVFMHEPDRNGSSNRADFKRQKGSIGIDLLISYKNEPVFGIDLKTGKGSSGSRNSNLSKRFGGIDIIEAQVNWH